MENEGVIRLSIFLGLFAVLALIETLAPRRPRRRTRGTRWVTNWSIVVLDTLALRLVALALPLLAVGAALDAERLGWGLFNQVNLSLGIEVILTVLIFDFVIWAQHLASHKIPLLWQIHQVHHADEDMDVTTAIRFHPVEIALSMLLKVGLVYLLGPIAVAVVIFEVLLNGTAMFNHANIRLPVGADRWVRKVLVTPDMHRVHHSDDRSEHDSNYGFALSIWDRIFSTYIAQPREGHRGMTVGLKWQDGEPTKLGWSLILPFRK